MTERLTRIARDERGFSLFAVILLLVVISAFAAAAWALANGDIPASAKDQHRNAAFDAAEAGVNYYLFHLNQDNSYWTQCDQVPGPGGGQPNPVVQAWSGTGPDTRTGHWRMLPSGNGQYAIELLPANGFTQCDPNNQLSMFDQSNGTFSIRSTGIVAGEKRSVIASFRHRGFLDYLYFTDFETIDPVANPSVTAPCNVYRRDGRSTSCPNIVFLDRDKIHGPFHTNDDIVVCGSPTIGRVPPDGGPDGVEISGPSPGYQPSGGCGATPTFSTPPKTGAPTLAMPPSNSSLASVAAPAYTFFGRTIITLNGANMTVNSGGTTTTMPAPPNGVIYVKTGAGGCGTPYDGTPDYNDAVACANVYVQGTYSKSLTIGSENDVIVTGNLLRSGGAVLGLIPNNFARVYHPVSSCTNLAAGSNGPPAGSGLRVPGQNMEVDAAILSLQHSWIVDNWACGAPLGTLTVNGAIAQRFRGPVGTFSGSSINSGYIKDYWYDDRLKYLSPPYFLDPIQSSWRISRETEQLPAR